MDEIRRILVFILCVFSAVSALSGKGYYCRDPDTGKLYPANSTWPSTTFCGNYTCNLRKITPSVSELLRKLSIANVNVTQTNKTRNDAQNDGEFAASNITPQIIIPTNTPNSVNDKTLPQLQDELNEIQEKLKQKFDLEGADRFLTDTEIKTISDLLHNVKKSDLEAIVDIYNLAQDIYKEMDKITSENIVEETMTLANNIKTERSNGNHISYWYDPINKAEIKTDMEHQGTNVVATTAQPKPVANPNTYFSGPLSGADFRKLPYYYPLSSFQRQSSYVHPTYNAQSQPQPPPPNVKPPCSNNNAAPVVHPPSLLYNYPPPQTHLPARNFPPQNNPPQSYGGVMKRPFTVETQKLIQPSVLLPYPFSYVQHYNMSTYPFNLYYAESPWTRFDINNQNSNQPKASTANRPKNSITDTDKKEISKPKLDINKTSILDSKLLENLVENMKIGKKPEWQTDPLPENVLEEVKAHFEEKAKLFKPFSLRKKVKLERVGKVVKLDELHREKRNIDDGANKEIEELEAFIEKTTCQSDIDPGFFRMGNLSEPYPACCPQRIDDSNK